MQEAWRALFFPHSLNLLNFFSRDALRSLVISQRLLGTREIAVYHHTGCGMVTFTGSSLRKLVKDEERGRPEAAELVDNIDFLEFGDLEQSVRDDVKFLQESPLILEGTKVTGWIHHVETGKVRHILHVCTWMHAYLLSTGGANCVVIYPNLARGRAKSIQFLGPYTS